MGAGSIDYEDTPMRRGSAMGTGGLWPRLMGLEARRTDLFDDDRRYVCAEFYLSAPDL